MNSFLSRAFFMSAFFAAMPAQAFPTIWNIENTTDAAWSFSCRATEVVGGVPLKTERIEVGPRAKVQYNWGGDIDNDGLGLNAARWSCIAEGDAAFGVFATRWDEPVTLRILTKGGAVKLQKFSSRK